MKLKLQSPIAGISGTHAGTDLILQNHGDQTFARARTVPTNPRTPDQQAIREIMRNSSREWQNLTAAQRAAWEKYHATHFPNVRTNGISMYNKASVMRGILGLPLSHPAPSKKPPVAIRQVDLVASGAPASLVLKLTHSITDPAAHSVIVRVTPPMPTVARKPRPSDYRLANGVGPASTHTLPASGANITIPLTRTPIPTGKRFGVEIRVVLTTDAIPSPPQTGDFIR